MQVLAELDDILYKVKAFIDAFGIIRLRPKPVGRIIAELYFNETNGAQHVEHAGIEGLGFKLFDASEKRVAARRFAIEKFHSTTLLLMHR